MSCSFLVDEVGNTITLLKSYAGPRQEGPGWFALSLPYTTVNALDSSAHSRGRSQRDEKSLRTVRTIVNDLVGDSLLRVL